MIRRFTKDSLQSLYLILFSMILVLSGLIFGFIIEENFFSFIDRKILNENYIGMILSFGSIILFLYLWVVLVEQRSFQSLYGEKKKISLNVFLFSLFTIILFTSIITIDNYFKFVEIEKSTFLNKNIFSILYFTVLSYISYIFIQAMAEELVIRGWLFQHLTNKWGYITGIILSSLAFTLLHCFNDLVLSIFELLELFLAGVFLAIIFHKTRNLWFPILFHGTWNWIQTVIFNVYGVGEEGMQGLFWNTKVLDYDLYQISIIFSLILLIFIVIRVDFYKSIKKRCEY